MKRRPFTPLEPYFINRTTDANRRHQDAGLEQPVSVCGEHHSQTSQPSLLPECNLRSAEEELPFALVRSVWISLGDTLEWSIFARNPKLKIREKI